MFHNRIFVHLALLSIFFTVILAGCRSSGELSRTGEEEEVQELPDPIPDEKDQEAESDDEERQEAAVYVTSPDQVPAPMDEFRGVWVATVANIDWPSRPGLPADQQQKEMIELLDKVAALHFNAVIFQVRPAADAFYDSPYEPWSYYLTGTMGESPAPAYDPLAFAIQEAHKRGLAFHAWFNPYRASHAGGNGEISAGHISRTHPEYVVRYGNFLWLDPGNEQAREHTLKVILDVVKRYDIDGVHMDDYFYPYPAYANGADFPDDKSWQEARSNGNRLSRADWRRDNVNRLIKDLSEKIKEVKPHVKFGISPFGIWRPGHPENTTGFDAYENLYADARLWLKEGWVDYFTPQLYYRIEQTPQPFPVMLEWWTEQNDHKRHLWPGLFTSSLRSAQNAWPKEEITGQIFVARGFPEVSGAVHFSMRVLLENSKNFNRAVMSGPYAFPSLLPETLWLGNSSPAVPELEFRDAGDYYTLRVTDDPMETVRWWMVQQRFGTSWHYDVVPANGRALRYEGGSAMLRPDEIHLTSLSRTGMKSGPAVLLPQQESQSGSAARVADQIYRDEWAGKSAAGKEVQAIRMKLSAGDTLRFLDLTVKLEGMIRSATFPSHLLKDPETASDDIREGSETIRLHLIKNQVSEEVRTAKGEALNWYGYHIAVLDTDFRKGTVELEIAPVTLLSVDRAALQSAGGFSQRFRIPHRIEKITLHTSIFTEEEGATVRSLKKFLEHSQAGENWWDVPFHYMISSDGTIYEGRSTRFAGDTRDLNDPRGELQIGLLDRGPGSSPSQEQLESAARLASLLIQNFKLTIDDVEFVSGDRDDESVFDRETGRIDVHERILRILDENPGW